jgi:hypothetical protein
VVNAIRCVCWTEMRVLDFIWPSRFTDGSHGPPGIARPKAGNDATPP